MPAVGRLGDKSKVDMCHHGCPACPHLSIGPAISGSPTVYANKQPILRVTDVGIHAACCGSNTWVATEGSRTVFVDNLPVHRVGDEGHHCGGTGTLLGPGSPNVYAEGGSVKHTFVVTPLWAAGGSAVPAGSSSFAEALSGLLAGAEEAVPFLGPGVAVAGIFATPLLFPDSTSKDDVIHEARDTGGGKTGRKSNPDRNAAIKEKIEKAEEDRNNASTKKERRAAQKQLDHLRRQLKPSEEHARTGQKGKP